MTSALVVSAFMVAAAAAAASAACENVYIGSMDCWASGMVGVEVGRGWRPEGGTVRRSKAYVKYTCTEKLEKLNSQKS